MYLDFNDLTDIQKNILIASIVADGEITKFYPNSRRKNNSYREHFGEKQVDYRRWKASYFDGLLYLRPNGNYLVSKSHSLFTFLYPYFYNKDGQKRVPNELLKFCNLPYFLAVLYLDDGSLCISKRINHLKKRIYLTPHIILYLQNFPPHELQMLKTHILYTSGFEFKLSKRNDGFGYILKLTKVKETLDFLSFISESTKSCHGMNYKLSWRDRLQTEAKKLFQIYPDYKVLTSDSDRSRNYEDEEINRLIDLKKAGLTDKEISNTLNRTYWSVVFKLKELRKDGHF